MKSDTAIFDIIEQERQRQLKGIELIASEVPYLFGYRRADLVAMINDNMVAFEIKSE